MKVELRDDALAAARKAYATIENLCDDLPDQDVEVDVPVDLSNAEVDWLFHNATLPDKPNSAALFKWLEFLDGPTKATELARLCARQIVATVDEETYYPPAIRDAWLSTCPPSLADQLTPLAAQEMAEVLFLPMAVQLNDPMLPPPSDRWCVAGGAVMNALLNEQRPTSDLDIFVYHYDEEALGQLLAHYRERWPNAWLAQCHRVLTLVVEGQRHVQIILTRHDNPYDLVLGFDAAPVQCFWNGRTAASPHCLQSLRSRLIYDYSCIRRCRARKYKDRGFHFEPEPEDDDDQREPLQVDWTLPIKRQLNDHYLGSDGAWPLKDYVFEWRNSGDFGPYMHDPSENEIRACRLPENWIDKLQVVTKKLHDKPVSLDKFYWRDKRVVFEVEQCIEPARYGTRLSPCESENPARAADAAQLLCAIVRLGEGTQSSVLTSPTNEKWESGPYILSTRPTASSILCNAQGQRLPAHEPAQVEYGRDRFAAQYVGRRVLARLELVAVLNFLYSGRRNDITPVNVWIEVQKLTLLD